MKLDRKAVLADFYPNIRMTFVVRKSSCEKYYLENNPRFKTSFFITEIDDLKSAEPSKKIIMR